MKEKRLFGRTVDGDIVELVAYAHDITLLVREGDTVRVLYEKDEDSYGWGEEEVYDGTQNLNLICKIETPTESMWYLDDDGEWH